MLRYVPLFALLVIGACAEPPQSAEQQFIASVVTAMGGEDRIRAANTLVVEAEGRLVNLGQDIVPESTTKEFGISDVTITVDLNNVRSHTRQTRTPLFPYFLGQDPVQQVFGLDDGIAYNLNFDGSARRMPLHVGLERQSAYYHHPLTLVRAMLMGTAQIQGVSDHNGFKVAEVVTQDDKTLRIGLDPDTQLPVQIRSLDHHPYLRDVDRATKFSDFKTFDGLVLPTTVQKSVDEFTIANISLLSQTVDADNTDLAAPREAAAAPVPTGPGPVEIAVEQIGEGVWFLVGRGYNSVVVEFADHLMLMEASDVPHTVAALAKARELVPDKPVTQLVNSHYHFDHSAGIRTAIAEGLTIITHASNEAFYRRLAKQPSTIIPDQLAENPRDLSIEAFEDKATYQDDSMTVEVYHLKGSPHTDGLIMAYVPSVRAVIQVDAFTPGSPARQTSAPNLLENMRRHNLDVQHVVPLHNNIVDLGTLEAAVAALESE